MDHRPVEQLTLRELFTNTEVLVRELTEHLQQAFVPRAKTVVELVESFARPQARSEIADSTVRSRMAALLASDDYSQQLFTRLEEHLAEITSGSQQAIQQR